VRYVALVLIVILLSFWLLQPAAIPPAEQLRDAASIAAFLLLIAASAGVAAMITVQFWKVLFLPRAAFHATELQSLFGTSMVQVLGLAPPTASCIEGTSPPRTSLGKSRASHSSPGQPKMLRHLLDNPTEVVMGQLRSAADYIILRPTGFEDALRLLAGNAGCSAVDEYLKQLGLPRADTSDSSSHLNDVVVQVRFFVEQNLNLVHLRLKERWRRRVRLVAVVVAGSTGLLTVALSNLGPTAKVSTIVAASVWGGGFSWLARDLMALAERRRS